MYRSFEYSSSTKKITFSFFALFFLTIFSLPSVGEAATLRLSPAGGSYNVGQTFSVSALVNSSDQAMNAASGMITFSPDILEVTSVSKGGSIMSLWVKEPSFTNSAGTVSFEGVVLNPGFTGSAGTIVTVTFRAKKEGTVSLRFSSAQVLANDGSGQNILSQSDGATFAIARAAQTTHPPPRTTTPSVPAVPRTNSLQIEELERKNTSPVVEFRFEITDPSFKAEYFRVGVNNESPKQYPPTIDDIYTVQASMLGKNTLTVRAVSKSGAFLEESVQFFVESLTPPVITEYPDTVGEEPLIIKGTTEYPLARVHITFRHNDEVVASEQVATDAQGSFIYANAHELVQGEYIVTARVEEKGGAQSTESSAVTLVVQKPFILYLGTFAINVLSALVVITLLLLLLIVLVLYSYFRIVFFRKKLKKEAREAETVLKKSIKLLKDDVSDLVSSRGAATELKEDIDEVEKVVGKEIRDIESLR
jgi:hypothetical protein